MLEKERGRRRSSEVAAFSAAAAAAAVSFGGRSSSVEAGVRANVKVKRVENAPRSGNLFFSRRAKSASGKNTGGRSSSRMSSA